MSKTIITNEDELKKLLSQQTNYSFGKLKRHFKFKTDYEFMDFLISYSEKEMKDFNFETEVDKNKYLGKLIKYFNYSLGKINLDDISKDREDGLSNIVSRLSNIENEMKSKIYENKTSFATDTCLKNCLFLYKMCDGIEQAINNMKKRINIEDDLGNIDYNNLVELFTKSVNELQNNEYLRLLMEKYPNLIYIKNSNHYIFESVLDKYFNLLLNKSDYDEKIYYDKLVDLFLKNDDINDEQILQNMFLLKSDKFITNLDGREIDKNRYDYILSTIKERIHKFSNKDIDFLTAKDNSSYYDHINLDMLKPLLGEKSETERVDLTDKYVITIDNDDAKMLENAISIEKLENNKYRLSIYASDVATAISENRDFDKNAYLHAINQPPKKRIFNHDIAMRKFSLNKGKEMPVMAYQFIVDKDLNCESFDFKKATVKVSKNLKFGDFYAIKTSSNEKLKNTVNNLLDVTFPDLTLDDLDERVASMIISLTNGFATGEIVKYTKSKNLPLIYLRTDFYGSKYKVRDDKNYSAIRNNLNLEHVENIVNTIGNDGIYEEDSLAISLFSPVRKIAALVNQMLVNIYLVDHNNELDFYTRNYLESQLDKIADNINDLSKSLLLDKSNVKTMGEKKNGKE